MSTIDSDDLETTGYFLPEDSQLRLKQLREYVEFLANLARPRMADEAAECFSEIRPGDVAICLQLLQEQVAQVLRELSWPAMRGETAAAGEADADAKACTQAAEPEVAGPVMDEAGNRLLVGVSLNQIDEINLLLSSLRALGNVVTCSDHAELSDVTLSIMGDAIVRDVETLRDIMRDVNAQDLQPPHATKPGVREEWATYHARPARVPIVRQLPTYQ
ncbi:XAC0095 family protein [Rhodanobacter terrae]|uniref:XAC0095 family protein n=1 Tax=Rhodanobacter terrae TaxID=418647 RepID=A0ABW0T2Y6_9GAMM